MENKALSLTVIKPNTYNPNEMTKQEFAEYVAEIQHLGKLPKKMILRKKDDFYEIVDGEHSYKALLELNIQELKPDWYEVVDIDDTEAKRQTYKRNQKGKNNPVKLGLMFLQAKEESGLSNRELAEKWDISEGMLRNYLIYAEVGKLRNDYATIAKLGVDQIRTYQKIAEYAKPVADYWLACGALKDALLVLDDNTKTYDKANYNVMGTLQKLAIRIMEQGFDKVLPLKSSKFLRFDLSKKEQLEHIQKFKTGFNRALHLPHFLEQMEKHFIWKKDATRDYLLEYLAIYYDLPIFFPPDWIKRLFSTSIRTVGNQLEFMLTPEEIRGCMEQKGNERITYIMEKAKEIIKQKYNIPTYELKESSESLEDKLDRLELESIAPEYIKVSSLPLKLRLAFMECKFPTDEARKTDWDIFTKNYKEREFKSIDLTNTKMVQEKITSIISAIKQKERQQNIKAELSQKTEQELAELFVEKLRMLTKANPEFEKDLTARLVKNFTKEYLYFFVFLATQYYNEMKLKAYFSGLVKDTKEILGGTKA